MKIFRKGPQAAGAIRAWLQDMRTLSFAPESHYAVAAVLRAGLGDEGDYYFAGVNVENKEHRLSLHAEENAIAAMVAGLGPHADIRETWLMAGPQDARAAVFGEASYCGKCRQQISGFCRNADVPMHTVGADGSVRSSSIGSFLPGAFVLDKRNTAPEQAPDEKTVQARLQGKSGLRSAEKFSRQPQTVTLQLSNGASVGGARMEDAAFLSINAAQAAVGIAVAEYGQCEIESIALHGDSLTLAAVQMLLPFAKNADIPVHHAGGDGAARVTTLRALAAV